jgi:hypothetical protein
MSAQVIATRSGSPASWKLGAVGRSEPKSISRSLRIHTSPFSTRPCTRPAICRISLFPSGLRVSTLRPFSTSVVNCASSMTTVSSPRC